MLVFPVKMDFGEKPPFGSQLSPVSLSASCSDILYEILTAELITFPESRRLLNSVVHLTRGNTRVQV